MLPKWSYNLQNDYQNFLCSLIKCCLMSSMLGNRRTSMRIFFSSWRQPFFERLPNDLLVPLKPIWKHIQQIWDNCYEMVFESCHTWQNEKKLSIASFPVEEKPFFEKLCFQQPFRSSRKYFLTTTINFNLTSGTYWTSPWEFSYSVTRGKRGRNCLSRGGSLFLNSLFLTTSWFLKNKVFKLQKNVKFVYGPL